MVWLEMRDYDVQLEDYHVQPYHKDASRGMMT